jgi:hypothetical protein
MARPQSVWSCRSGIAWTKLKLGGPTGVHRSSASHRRRITLILFYLIAAILRGPLGRYPIARKALGLSGFSCELFCRVLGERRPMPPRGMGNMSRVIAVIACGLMLAACSATMPSLDFLKSAPQPETLAIESEPPGAEAKTSLGQSCRTPCQFAVQPGSEFSVTLALSGYQPQTVSVRPDAEATSAAPRLAPNPVHVTLQAVKPTKKPVAKKKTPIASAIRPAASPSVASAARTAAAAAAPTAPALAPAPSSPAEAAPSATNYPWPSR